PVTTISASCAVIGRAHRPAHGSNTAKTATKAKRLDFIKPILRTNVDIFQRWRYARILPPGKCISSSIIDCTPFHPATSVRKLHTKNHYTP
ncbi:MAG: hypothetical protein ACYS14_06020, partial [Planctomycetota bacterium]